MKSSRPEKVIMARMGVKMSGIHWPFSRDVLPEILTRLNYGNMQMSEDGSINASRSNVVFYLANLRLAFGFKSNVIETVIDAQKQMFDAINKEEEADLSRSVRFYEVEYVSHHITDKSIPEVYAGVLDDSAIKREFEDITGRSLRASRLEFDGGGGLQDDSRYSIEVSPRVESSGNAYFCKILYRDVDVQKVRRAIMDAPETLRKAIARLEG